MNSELKRMLKEITVAYFKTFFKYLPGGTQKNHETDSIIGLPAEILTEDIQNIKQECQPLGYDVEVAESVDEVTIS